MSLNVRSYIQGFVQADSQRQSEGVSPASAGAALGTDARPLPTSPLSAYNANSFQPSPFGDTGFSSPLSSAPVVLNPDTPSGSLAPGYQSSWQDMGQQSWGFDPVHSYLRQVFDTGLGMSDAESMARQPTDNSCGLAAAYSLRSFFDVPGVENESVEDFVAQHQKFINEEGVTPGVLGALLGKDRLKVTYADPNFDEDKLQQHLLMRQPVLTQLDPDVLDADEGTSSSVGATSSGPNDRTAHYVLVTGYDPVLNSYTLMDPALGVEREVPHSKLKKSVDVLGSKGGGMMAFDKESDETEKSRSTYEVIKDNHFKASRVGKQGGGASRRSLAMSFDDWG